MGDDLLTTREVSEEMKVSPDTVRGWISRRLLRAIKKGHDNLIPRNEVDRFKAEYDPKPGPKPKKDR